MIFWFFLWHTDDTDLADCHSFFLLHCQLSSTPDENRTHILALGEPRSIHWTTRAPEFDCKDTTSREENKIKVNFLSRGAVYLLRKVAKISANFRFSEDNASLTSAPSGVDLRFSDEPSAKAVLVLLSVRKSKFSLGEQNAKSIEHLRPEILRRATKSLKLVRYPKSKKTLKIKPF